MSPGRSRNGPGEATTAAGVPHVRAVDGFRFFALAGVVIVHLLLAAGVLQRASDAGEIAIWWLFGNVIDGFFIISGFGLFLSVVASQGRIEGLGNWAIRRGARILPAYWLCLATLLLLLAIWPQPERLLLFPGLREVGVHLVGLQLPMRIFDGGFPIGFNAAPAVWMISVIIGFYLVFPLIARSYYKHPFAGLAVAAVITLAWREAALHEPLFFDGIENGPTPAWVTVLMVSDQLPGWAFSFALGMTAAWLYHRFKAGDESAAVSARLGLGIVALGLVAYAICGYLYATEAASHPASIAGTQVRAHDPLLGEAYSVSRAFLMAGIAMAPLWVQWPFINRPVRAGAELSYAVYLIHMPITLWVGGVWLGLTSDGTLADALAWFGVVIPLSFGYAFFSSRAVERPAIRWARQLTRIGPEPSKRLRRLLPGVKAEPGDGRRGVAP